MSVFVDSGMLVANAIRNERRHAEARSIVSGLIDESPFTTDHVLVESWHIVRARAGHFHAMRFWLGLRETPLSVECVTGADLERAAAIGQTWPDQEFDLVDCTSFAVMERVGCRRAATFDSDFAVYRYGADRTKAFEIVRSA
jgi:predicted nucleic acid-binding protein